MRKITILFILISFCSFGQKKYFKEAIEKGRSTNEFYFCNLGDGKVVTESDINDYANKNNIIIKNMTFQQVNRFGDSFTGVSTFKFLPITEIPNYVFSRYIDNSSTIITLENIKKYNKGFGNIYNPKTNSFTYQEVYWSNEVLNNNLQGKGIGLYINENEMLFFKGTFDKGILIGEGNFKQYVYNSNFDFESGSLIENGILIGNFKNDFAIFKSNNKYGFIDSKFNFITQVKYNSIEKEFENGRALVTLNNEKIIIDEKGNFIDYTQEQKDTFELTRRLKEQEERKLAYYKPQIEAYNRIANELSYKYMKQISPNTGKNNSYKFLNNDFEQNVREVTINWIAKQYALADNYHNLQVTGRIYLEEGRFEQISENGNTTAIRNSNNQLNFWKDMGNLAFDGVKTLLASLPETDYSSTSYSSSTNSDSEIESSSNENNTKKDVGKHIEFREDRTADCSQGKVIIFKVYENGKIYEGNSTIKVGDYNGSWHDGCANGGMIFNEQTSKSKITLKQFLIQQYESGTSNADSYTLTTK